MNISFNFKDPARVAGGRGCRAATAGRSSQTRPPASAAGGSAPAAAAPHKTPSNVRLTPLPVPAHSNRSVGLGPAAQGGRALAMLSLLLPAGMAHLHPAAEHAVPQGLNAAPGAHNARVNDQPASAEQLARHLSSSLCSLFILVPEGTSMSALTVQVLRLSLSLGSVTAVNLRRSVCGAQGSLDR